MPTRTLYLPTVYSQLADNDAIRDAGLACLPYRIAQHQFETYLALRSGSAPLIFNTAMTGDGKTLAGLLAMLTRPTNSYNVMTLYPTNELVRDQFRAIGGMKGTWQVDFPLKEVNSRALDERVAAMPIGSRGDALMSLLSNADLVLSNPDIFHYVMQFFYIRKGKHGDAPDRIAGRLIPNFAQITFDEFHIFETPQIISVLNALLFLLELGHTQRFLFLSATPGETMQRYLERASLSSQVIRGSYRYGDDPGDGWRRILHGTTLHLTTGRADEWVMANAERIILPFLQAHGPAAKGAIIVNSVATAERLTAQLRTFFRERNLPYTVEKNTGLSGPAARRRSYEADLLVGTATVDVGVDFHINFLIFESRDAGSFLQRLGRLGRHDGFTRSDGTFIPFTDFVAHALVPDFVYERLCMRQSDGEASLLADDETTVQRERLSEVMRAAFPTPTDFRLYASRWGMLQSASLLNDLNNKTIRDSYDGVRQRLRQRYEATFGGSIGTQLKRMVAFKESQQLAILEEARSFRGGSPWQAAVIDERTSDKDDRFLLYDLRTLLANFHVSIINEEGFASEAQRWGIDLRRFDRASPIAHLRLHSLRDERVPLTVTIDDDLTGWSTERLDSVTLLSGLGLQVAGVDDLNALNRRIAHRTFVALVTQLDAASLQRKLYLPWPFPIERIEGNDRTPYSIAFGREALLLETAMRGKGMMSDREGAIVL